jgi:hypothetical protein
MVRPLPVEQVPPREKAAIRLMISVLKKQLVERYLKKGELVRRDAHPKHHGLVSASFVVDPACPVQLRHGIFVPGSVFDAVIRFSNGQPIVGHDLGSDLRGIAIKLTLPPARSATDELSFLGDRQQDFLLATGETFFGKDAVDFAPFPAASESPSAIVRYFVGGLRLRGAMALVKGQKTPASPLDVEYFSQTPYRLGPHCVKYQVRPAARRDGSGDPRYLRPLRRRLMAARIFLLGRLGREHAIRFLPGFNGLAESLARDLDPVRGQSVTLEFLVQRWPDLTQLPVAAIEDATVRWKAPWVKVATIEIPPQPVRERDAEAETTSFTPWRALRAHQPLGSIARARLEIYREMSRFRAELNQRSEQRSANSASVSASARDAASDAAPHA